MKITIYDYESTAKECEIPASDVKDIDTIMVNVISGDEEVWVHLKNGKRFYFDASDCRIIAYDDGTYFVEGTENIQKWLDYKPSGKRTASYERQEMFD